MYCKYRMVLCRENNSKVLIVAKCIVNLDATGGVTEKLIVLIVAKCIVNELYDQVFNEGKEVLIVAKCIVNFLWLITQNKLNKY